MLFRSADDYSDYSFSSKILEYMASGTPLLTTKVGGMPEEYWKYCYFIVDETCDGIAQAIKSVMEKTAEELRNMGVSSREFAIKQKNCFTMVKEITDFLKMQFITQAVDGEFNEDQI